MAGRTALPYGSWPSPFPIDVLTAGRVGLGECRFDDGADAVVWLENRPQDAGRQTLVRWTPTGGARDISPPGMNVRDRVHEYGGAPSLVQGDLVVVSDFATGLLHRVAADGSSRPVTPDGPFRYADLVLDPARDRILAIREDHSGPGEAINTIVGLPLDGSGAVRVLAEGRTFYAAPRLAPDGGRLAYLAWDHPNMPWDGTKLQVAPIEADGAPGRAERVAGSASDWISQPRWSPQGVLHFVAEPDGWMNLHRWREGRIEPIAHLEAEFAYPDWQFGYRNYAFEPDGTIVAIGRSRGADRLYRIRPDGRVEIVAVPFTELGSIDAVADRAVLLATGPRAFN